MVTLLLSNGVVFGILVLVLVFQIVMMILAFLGRKTNSIGELVDSIDTFNEKFDELSFNYENMKQNNSDELVKINDQLVNLTQRIEMFEASFSKILNIKSIDSSSIMEEPEKIQVGNVHIIDLPKRSDNIDLDKIEEKKIHTDKTSKDGKLDKLEKISNIENFEVEEEQ